VPGHGYNTWVGDAVNIGWKIAAVEQGWASPDLLATYEPERRGVVEQTVETAVRNMQSLPTDLQNDAAAILAAKTVEFQSLGLVLGYTYAGSPVVQPGNARSEVDTETFVPTSDPGARLPHTWLPDGSSLFDQLGRSLTLVGPVHVFPDEVAELVRDAYALRIPLTLVEPPDTYPWHDEFLLVRPAHRRARRQVLRDIDLAHVTGRGRLSPSRGRTPV
jgi:FAD binding domain